MRPRRGSARAAGLASFALICGAAWSDVARSPSRTLVGANYTHWALNDCSLNRTGIVRYYDDPGVRYTVVRQLAAMRAASVETLRLILWHEANPSAAEWGVVPSDGGRLTEPYRTNLITYLGDVRRAGFRRLTVSFAPMSKNAPLLYRSWRPEDWDPTKLEENWRFIREIRPLVKRYGPPSTHIDLINEGVPGPNDPARAQQQANAYIGEIYAKYVDAFGNDDVTVSTIASGASRSSTKEDLRRIQSLVGDIRAGGRAFPRWFEVHISYTKHQALEDLYAVDHALTANNLSQPLVVGETAYDDGPVAQAISTFLRTSSRPVTEVIEWPLRRDHKTCTSAPYRVDAFVQALTGSMPAQTLTGVVRGQTVTLTTAYGQPVTALQAGTYNLRVKDLSTTAGFTLTGGAWHLRTGDAFTGVRKWRLLKLKPGPYIYGTKAFEVIPTG